MKHLSLLSIFILAGLFALAQQSLTFPYQALVRDENGNPITNQQIGAKITLYQDSIAEANKVYQEEHYPTTNAFGQMELLIGSQKPADFDVIPWGAGPMFIKLEVDLQGGTDYQEIATHQLLAVPFAKYAEEAAGWRKSEKGIAFENGNVQIGDYLIDANLSVQGNIFFKDTSYISTNGQNMIRNYIQTVLMDTEQYYGYVQGLKVYSAIEENSTVGSEADEKYIMTLNSQQNVYGNLYGDSYGVSGTCVVRPGAYVSGDVTGVYGHVTNYGTIDGNSWAGLFTGNACVRSGSSGHDPTSLAGLFVENNGVSNTSFVFQTATAGGGKSLSVTNAGNVGIGTISPGSYKLNVAGNFYAYNMKTSSLDLKTYLEKRNNKTLSNPSEIDITEVQNIIEQDTTIDLGKMNLFLLEKIDQLIQSNIQQQKENNDLRQQFQALKSEIENLKNK
jgi:hypothetical protein